MSEYLYTHDALTVPRGADAGQLLESRPPCDAGGQLDVAAFRDRGFLILKDAAASDAIARAAAYVATHEACWSAPSGTRPDDWRMHRDQRLDAPVADGHLPILDLLREPRLAAAIRCLAGAEAHAVSYTQVARRTPAPRKARRRDLPDTSYHIDGEANASGARFPDVFSLLVAVALTPHERPGMGNLTVSRKAICATGTSTRIGSETRRSRTSAGPTRSRWQSATRFCAILCCRTAAAAMIVNRRGTSSFSGCNWRASTTRRPNARRRCSRTPGPSYGFRRLLNFL